MVVSLSGTGSQGRGAFLRKPWCSGWRAASLGGDRNMPGAQAPLSTLAFLWWCCLLCLGSSPCGLLSPSIC